MCVWSTGPSKLFIGEYLNYMTHNYSLYNLFFALENMHCLPDASTKSVQFPVTPANPPAQVSLRLSRVWRQLPLGPLPVPRHQELPALHPKGWLPVSCLARTLSLRCSLNTYQVVMCESLPLGGACFQYTVNKNKPKKLFMSTEKEFIF